MRVTVLVLVSGGIDSAVLTWHLLDRGSRVLPVYVREGLAWEAVELLHLKRFLGAIASPALDPLRVLDLPMADIAADHWSLSARDVPASETPDEAVYLPGRNLVLLAKAAVLAADAGADAIALGILAGNPFRDATAAFLGAMEQAIALGLDRPIRVLAPFHDLSKSAVLALGANLPLELTFSCLAPVGDRPCGACNKCAERHRAFVAAGRADPTPYVSFAG